MRQLKIHKSTTPRREVIPSVTGILWEDPFDIDRFLQQVNQAKPLTPEEELELIAQAKILDGAPRIPLTLSPQDLERAIVQATENEAMSHLMWHYAQAVIDLSNLYADKEVSLQKLLKAGMQGLKDAIMEYDIQSQEGLLAFATPLIQQHLQECINKNSTSAPNNTNDK